MLGVGCIPICAVATGVELCFVHELVTRVAEHVKPPCTRMCACVRIACACLWTCGACAHAMRGGRAHARCACTRVRMCGCAHVWGWACMRMCMSAHVRSPVCTCAHAPCSISVAAVRGRPNLSCMSSCVTMKGWFKPGVGTERSSSTSSQNHDPMVCNLGPCKTCCCFSSRSNRKRCANPSAPGKDRPRSTSSIFVFAAPRSPVIANVAPASSRARPTEVVRKESRPSSSRCTACAGAPLHPELDSITHSSALDAGAAACATGLRRACFKLRSRWSQFDAEREHSLWR